MDVLKGIGIYLVILGHTVKDDGLYLWIYSFHMPLFFFISGWLTEPKERIGDYRLFVAKKTKSLLWPFIFFRIALVLYWLLVERHFRELDLGPIWFLVVLFFVEVIFVPPLCKWRKEHHCIIAMLACVYLFIALDSLTISNATIHHLIGWAERIFNSGIWFCMAFLARKVTRKLELSKTYSWVVFLAATTISVSMAKQNGNVSIFSNDVNNIILYLLLGLCGIGSMFLLCNLMLNKQNQLEWIGKHTIIILAIHEPIKRVLLQLSSMAMETDVFHLQSSVCIAIVISIITLIACVPVIYGFISIKKRTGKIGNVILNFVR